MSETAALTSDSTIGPLRPADEAASLREYLRSVFQRRDYVWYVAQSQLRSRQMDTVLGNLWHLLNPMLQIGVYYVVFGLVLQTDRGVDNFLAFIAVGLFVYQFTLRSTNAGARSVTNNENLLRSIWFPRVILPATSTLAELLSFLPALVVMFAVCLATGESPSATWLVIPVLVALQLTFNLGLAMVVARMATTFRDIQQLLPFVFRLLFYASGVIFLVDAYVEQSSWRLLFELNPLYAFVSLYRSALLGFDLNDHTIVVAPGAALVMLVFGFWWFRRAEQEYGRG